MKAQVLSEKECGLTDKQVSDSDRIRTLWATFGLMPEPCRSKVPVMNQKLLASENWLTR